MKSLTQHITEKLVLNNTTKVRKYNYHPKTNAELQKLVEKLVEERGNESDLNDIDTSQITDMSWIFDYSTFNGDISGWDVSNVKTMEGMFAKSEFTGENGDISGWDVSSVENMSGMFKVTKYNGDISKWDVSSVKRMGLMFYESEFTGENGDISKWDVSNVITMWAMFEKSKFNGDISNWNVGKVMDMHNMFKQCPIKEEYKPKFNIK